MIDIPKMTTLTGIVNISGPFHASEFHPPSGPTTYYVSFPSGKRKGRRHCRYCHTQHGNWWQMREKDFGRPDILLCGECLHTSPAGKEK